MKASFETTSFPLYRLKARVENQAVLSYGSQLDATCTDSPAMSFPMRDLSATLNVSEHASSSPSATSTSSK
jgi:hypothetical protein